MPEEGTGKKLGQPRPGRLESRQVRLQFEIHCQQHSFESPVLVEEQASAQNRGPEWLPTVETGASIPPAALPVVSGRRKMSPTSHQTVGLEFPQPTGRVSRVGTFD